MRKITLQLREVLAKPMAQIVQTLPEGRKAWACVGDYSCRKLLEQGVEVKIVVYDLKTKRVDLSQEEKDFFQNLDRQEITCVNPPGTITCSLEKAVGQAAKAKAPVKVFVEGEEDLTVLPLIERAPFNALVVYGQPGEGMVVVECSTDAKRKARELLEMFEEEE